MAQVIWTEKADRDVDVIVDFISIDSPVAAKSLHAKILSATDRLSDFPHSGRKVSEFPDLGFREVVVNPCRIIYEFENKKVYILRVIRSERKLRIYMLETHKKERRVLHEK